ncbi:MAG: hypothetical protein M9915_01505 [Rhizobacter sp.]|nr:hypothetical protein [Rhizobacter sp.]
MSKLLILNRTSAFGPRNTLSRPARLAAARALGAASMLLGRLAAALSASQARAADDELPPVLEFYADAAAPEGALYLNGELVGTLHGVKRL